MDESKRSRIKQIHAHKHKMHVSSQPLGCLKIVTLRAEPRRLQETTGTCGASLSTWIRTRLSGHQKLLTTSINDYGVRWIERCDSLISEYQVNPIRPAILAFILVLQQPVVFAQSTSAEGVPALKVSAPNGASNVLIGSLHIPASGLRQPAVSVMDRAKRYVVEGVQEPNETSFLNDRAPEVPPGSEKRADWSKALTDAQISNLTQFASCNIPGLDANSALNFILSRKSAAVAAEVAVRKCAPQGLVSRDDLLAQAASARGLLPLPLETQAQANKQRQAVPERIHRFNLIRAFSPESSEALRRTVHALNTGAYEEIIKALDDLAASPADAETLKKLMIADRNRAWLPMLSKYLDAGHSVVNVGAAHLPGPDGLIAMLRARGYRVEPIMLPSIIGGK